MTGLIICLVIMTICIIALAILIRNIIKRRNEDIKKIQTNFTVITKNYNVLGESLYNIIMTQRKIKDSCDTSESNIKNLETLFKSRSNDITDFSKYINEISSLKRLNTELVTQLESAKKTIQDLKEKGGE